MESKGNPRLNTLELITKGLKSELLLIPQEMLNAVLAVLADDTTATTEPGRTAKEKSKSLADDPWQRLLGKTNEQRYK